MTRRGLFIAFEGGDGCGKTTQIAHTVNWLARFATADIIRTREPGGCPSAETIRDLVVRGKDDAWTPMTELLLIAAARSEHVTKLIRPSLERGAIVVTDRFVGTTIAYQGYGRGIDLRLIQQINQAATGGLYPDLTILLDAPPNVGLARSTKRLADQASEENRFEGLDVEFHIRARNGFLQQAADAPDRHIVIDASQSLEAMRLQIVERLDEYLLGRADLWPFAA